MRDICGMEKVNRSEGRGKCTWVVVVVAPGSNDFVNQVDHR